MIKTKKIRVDKNLALFQIVFLILGTIAIAYSIGSSFVVVSAQGPKCVEVYNSGGILVNSIHVPEDFDIIEDCPGTQCKFVTCPEADPTRGRQPATAATPVPTRSLVIRQFEDVALQQLRENFLGSFSGEDEDPTDEEIKEFCESHHGVCKDGEIPGESGNGNQSGFPLVLGTIVKNAGVSAALGLGSREAAKFFGASPELSNNIGLAVSIGWFVGKGLGDLGFSFFANQLGFLSVGGLVGIGIGLFIVLITYKKKQVKIVTFSCNPWTPPKGGADCGLCNENELGCSEYQCRSLGASCEIVNKGTTEELCTWINRNDVQPPSIEAWKEILSPDYIYTPDDAISPPDRGVKIVKKNPGSGSNCIEPNFRLKFGVTLDEPGKCKIDTIRQDSFENMNKFFQSGSTYKHNHFEELSIPSPSALASENITLANGGVMDLFVRCEDRNGNSNTATFSFNFCVDEGPDGTAPEIIGTSILNGLPIGFNTSSVELDVFINEPAECKWDKIDKSYNDMEHQMTCSSQDLIFGPHTCSTTLTGLKDKVNNDFYFRCEDLSEKKNKNAQSYLFTLIGTQPLVISKLSPQNEIIKDSIDIIKVTLEVETSAGYNEGEAICSYKGFGTSNRFVEFAAETTNSFQHSQPLFLPEGDYSYEIRCVDLGGNADNGVIDFSVESDNQAPVIVRVYHEAGSLKIVTNEESECVYDNFGCNYLFDDGIKMNSVSDKEHFTTWDPDRNFNIKCRDKFLNEPLPNSCSIEVRPFNK